RVVDGQGGDRIDDEQGEGDGRNVEPPDDGDERAEEEVHGQGHEADGEAGGKRAGHGATLQRPPPRVEDARAEDAEETVVLQLAGMRRDLLEKRAGHGRRRLYQMAVSRP